MALAMEIMARVRDMTYTGVPSGLALKRTAPDMTSKSVSEADLNVAGCESAPVFDAPFKAMLTQLIAWRRDVRRFRRDPVEAALIGQLLDLAQFAPSVGNSQPWRWVSVEDPRIRESVRQNFRRCNADALAHLQGERAETYARLKLEGLDAAPCQFAIFCDRETNQGCGLGRQTMPEALDHSVAAMISTFWLAARAAGLGVGWVSILEPTPVKAILEVPECWKLIAYLCVGWPEEEHIDPELVRHRWQPRTTAGRNVLVR
jgi:5,6-dimethylbenzimidazole synthase